MYRWLFLALTVTPAATAQQADTAAVMADTATLVVHNHPIITFRGSLGALNARERAEAATRRIADAGQAAVVVRRVPEGALVVVGERGVFTVTPAEVDTMVGETLGGAAARAAERTERAIEAGIEQRSLTAIARGIALSIVATILFLLVLRLLRIGRRALQARILQQGRERLKAVTLGTYKLFDTRKLLLFVQRLVEIVTWGLALFLAYLWLTFVLTQFAYSRPWGEALGRYLVNTMGSLAVGILHGIPGLFTVILIFVITRLIARLISTFFEAVQAETVTVPWLHPDTVAPTRRIVVALLWLFALAMAYPYLPGSDSDIFKGVSVFAGLIITLGSTGVVGQAMSGLVLMYSRSLKVGEYVHIAGTEGTVADLGVLATKIRTTKNELVTIPNAVVVATATKNFTRYSSDGVLLLHTTVTIGYDAPWRRVHALLIEAARRTPGLLDEPVPFVLQTALSDFYVEYELNARLEQPERRIPVLAALHENIQDVFNENGVQIMSPHFREQPAEPVIVPKERWSE